MKPRAAASQAVICVFGSSRTGTATTWATASREAFSALRRRLILYVVSCQRSKNQMTTRWKWRLLDQRRLQQALEGLLLERKEKLSRTVDRLASLGKDPWS